MKRANFPGRKDQRRKAALQRLEESYKRLKGRADKGKREQMKYVLKRTKAALRGSES